MEAFRWCLGWRWRWWRLPGPAQKALGPALRWRLGGRYRLIEPIGRGGWSTVWRGYDERLSRPVAIKLLDASQAEWVRREAKALASLTHAHIAMIYDCDCTGSECYLVLEFVEGCSLADALDQGPLPWPEAVRYCAQLATALAAAHRRNLVHRDVKPGNVMLTPSGVKLIDFGTSRVVGEVDPDEVLRATPAYVAPERLTGDEVGPAGDVFGLGAVLYRAIAGHTPWTGTTVHEILTALTTTDPPPLPSTAGVPDAVAQVCLSCLSRDPGKRPTAEQVASILSEAVPDSVVRRPTVTLALGGPRHRRPPKPHSASIRAAIAAGLVALLAGLGYLLTESHPARSPVASVQVVTPNCRPGGTPAPGAVGDTLAGTVVVAPPDETGTVQNGHGNGKSNMDVKDRGGPQKRGRS